MRVLAIETSCDETAASIVAIADNVLCVLAHTVSSQAAIHERYGGVVPNLAAREHVKNIVPVLETTLGEAKLSPAAIDAIAVTQGPGLIPALLVGVSAAKTLAIAWRKPLIGINHLEGHIYANFIGEKFEDGSLMLEKNGKRQTTYSKNQSSAIYHQSSIFPLLVLIVSGGHTQLVLMRDHFEYALLGETEDDAAGEAFDKVARMLGLPYPGGPVVAKRADEFRVKNERRKAEDSFSFPRPMSDADNYQFSFSGLKTSVLYFLRKHKDKIKDKDFIATVCHEFQEAVVDTLVGKTERAIQEFSPKTVVIAGGVSANVRLRARMQALTTEKYPGTHFRMPEFQYSLDNASMIGAAAAYRFARLSPEERENLKANALTLEPNANLPLV